jgi:plasmid stability protein
MLQRSSRRFFIDMCTTCIYVFTMSKMIQLRNVPDALHRKLKARAALEGLSLSDYLLAELRRFGEKPTLREMRDRLSHRRSVRTRVSPTDAVREERERL